MRLHPATVRKLSGGNDFQASNKLRKPTSVSSYPSIFVTPVIFLERIPIQEHDLQNT